jgi:autotransporter-associated beta strand protein
MAIEVVKSSRRTIAAGVTATLLAGTCLSPVAVAQTWTGGAGTADGGTAANWSPATVPGTGAIAQFGASTSTVVNTGRIQLLDGIQFNAGAPSYTINLGAALSGTGIVNNSNSQQNINVVGSSSNVSVSFIVNNSSGGTNIVVDSSSLFVSNSLVLIDGKAGGVSGNPQFAPQFTLKGSGGSTGEVTFGYGSTAGNATFHIDKAGMLYFEPGSKLGTSQIFNASARNTTIDGADGSQAFYTGTADASNLIVGITTTTPVPLGGIAGRGQITLNAPLVVGSANLAMEFAGQISGPQSLTKVGTTTLLLTNDGNSFPGLTVTGGLVGFTSLGALGRGPITLNGGGLQWAPGTTVDVSSILAPLGASGATFDTNGNNVTLAGALTGGPLFKLGAGTLTLTGANTYGGTVVAAGVLQGNSTSLRGNIINFASVVFNQTGSGTYAGVMSGPGSMTLQGGGTLTLTGFNTYTGTTTVNASKLVVNGAITNGDVVLTNGGILGGSGIIGNLTVLDGRVLPGNSIGTLNIGGNLVKHRGHYHAELNAAGQSDRINVGGTATINAGNVVVLPEPGIYANSTTHTIVSAAGGVSGAYTGIESDLAFLKPAGATTRTTCT